MVFVLLWKKLKDTSAEAMNVGAITVVKKVCKEKRKLEKSTACIAQHLIVLLFIGHYARDCRQRSRPRYVLMMHTCNPSSS